MCGIFCSVFRVGRSSINHRHTNVELPACTITKLKKHLAHRGPDVTQEVDTKLTSNWSCKLIGNVLWTQGEEAIVQPLQDNDDNFLLWNGDVLYGELESGDRCDSETVFENLKTDPLATIANIGGPYAFVFWHSEARQLWFSRDVLGRQSLVWSVSADHLTLSSTSHKSGELSEVPALGVFLVDFSTDQQVEVQFFPWAHLTTALSSLTDVLVTQREKIYHFELGDGESRLSWLNREPTEGDISVYRYKLTFEELCSEQSVMSRVDQLLDKLTESVACRVNKQPGVCKDCVQACSHCSVAVLFSGGLDSTVIALLAHRFVPRDHPIDLYNVAFQQQGNSFEVPDRLTGVASVQELKELAPNRTWNFVKVDVSSEELVMQRAQAITDLIHPLTSVLDDSIGCALWFAARGKGCLNGRAYSSPARVVLLGMGADEQLGGYTRHRNTLRHTGRWAALGDELVADTDNIGRRNLGRDNRVVSDHGRQPRTPFLDERVVAFINTLPPWHRCQPTSERPPGVGDKILLRLVAWRLGLRAAASLPKRALQFGSRIANRKEKGNQVSQRL